MKREGEWRLMEAQTHNKEQEEQEEQEEQQVEQEGMRGGMQEWYGRKCHETVGGMEL